MRNYKTKGVVLKSMKLGEADKIVTIFTEEQGKVAAVAKGVRRTKSRFGARLESFTNLELVIHNGKSGLDTIIQADIRDSYPGLVQSLERINYGYAMLELVDKLTPDRQPEPKIYQMLAAALGCLDATPADSRLILIAFDLKLLTITGFLPNLAACVVCNTKTKPVERFSPEQGGMLCGGCLPGDETAFPVEAGVLNLVSRLLYSPFREIEDLKVQSSHLVTLDHLLMSHLLYHLNLRLKVRDFLEQVVDDNCYHFKC